MSKERKGDYCRTTNGIGFYPLDPKNKEILIDDIACALARICRFTGHIKRDVSLYSVAQHSVLVSSLLPDNLKLRGLLHDASEAYLSDIARPVKRQPELHRYVEIEYLLERKIFKRFGIDLSFGADEVRHADSVILATEMRDITDFPEIDRKHLPSPVKTRIVPWSYHTSREVFLREFKKLTRGTYEKSA